jgi:hypothetical protein
MNDFIIEFYCVTPKIMVVLIDFNALEMQNPI